MTDLEKLIAAYQYAYKILQYFQDNDSSINVSGVYFNKTKTSILFDTYVWVGVNQKRRKISFSYELNFEGLGSRDIKYVIEDVMSELMGEYGWLLFHPKEQVETIFSNN